MKPSPLTAALLLAPSAGSCLACGSCASLVRARIQADGFLLQLLLVLVPALLMASVAAAVHHAHRLPWRRRRP